MKVFAFALVFVAVCACMPAPDGSEAGGNAACDVASGSAGGPGGAGGSNACQPCEPPLTPRRLRQVRVRDSRGLEPDTLVLATTPDSQTLWLPDATNNLGAIVVVKDVAGTYRTMTVTTSGDDLFQDGSGERATIEPWTSWTFIAVDGGTWFLVDEVN